MRMRTPLSKAQGLRVDALTAQLWDALSPDEDPLIIGHSLAFLVGRFADAMDLGDEGETISAILEGLDADPGQTASPRKARAGRGGARPGSGPKKHRVAHRRRILALHAL